MHTCIIKGDLLHKNIIAHKNIYESFIYLISARQFAVKVCLLLIAAEARGTKGQQSLITEVSVTIGNISNVGDARVHPTGVF